MTEEGHSVTAKDSKTTAETASPSPSSAAPSPWSAEEQKVERINFVWSQSIVFLTASNSRRPYAPFLSQKRTDGIKSLPWYHHGVGRNAFGDTRYTFYNLREFPYLFWSSAGTRKQNTGKTSVKTELKNFHLK